MSYAYWMSQRDEAEEWGDCGQYRMAGWYADEAAQAGNWETDSEPDYEPDYDDENYDYDDDDYDEEAVEHHRMNSSWYFINKKLDHLYKDSTDLDEIKEFYSNLVLCAYEFCSKHTGMMSGVFDAIKANRVEYE